MEEEERAAQSAKLQELIRRGTPHDLQEANKLMKVMAGYDTRNKTDYRAKAAEEVSRVQQKAKILEEMLQGVQEGGKVEEGDVFEVSGRPKRRIRHADCARNSQTPYRAPIPRSRKCAKRNPMMLRLSINCLKSTTVFIGPLRDIS